jgi:hypothetical protein
MGSIQSFPHYTKKKNADEMRRNFDTENKQDNVIVIEQDMLSQVLQLHDPFQNSLAKK